MGEVSSKYIISFSCLVFFSLKDTLFVARTYVQEVYMRYPGAAERLDAQNRTKLMRIEVMKKEREVIVKAEQAAKLQEIKGEVCCLISDVSSFLKAV